MMMVTPRIIIQEEEEEKLGVPSAPVIEKRARLWRNAAPQCLAGPALAPPEIPSLCRRWLTPPRAGGGRFFGKKNPAARGEAIRRGRNREEADSLMITSFSAVSGATTQSNKKIVAWMTPTKVAVCCRL